MNKQSQTNCARKENQNRPPTVRLKLTLQRQKPSLRP